MALVAAICTQCGARIEVDDALEAGVCKHCGMAFVTEKAINNYQINNFVYTDKMVIADEKVINMWKQVEAYDKLNMREKSIKTLRELSEITPGDSRVWEALAQRAYTLGTAVDNMKKAVAVAEESQKQRLEDALEKYIDTFEKEKNSRKEEFCRQKEQATQMIANIQMFDGLCYKTNEYILGGYCFKVKNSRLYFGEIEVIPKIEGNFCKFQESTTGRWCSVKRVWCEFYNAYYNSASVKEIEISFSIHEIIELYKNRIEPKEWTWNKNEVKIAKDKNGRKITTTKGACYIATCVYSSYDCPQVWTLRRFRDDILGVTWYGKIFIQLYYFVSPKLVKRFGSKEWFIIFWKKRLDKIIDKLNEQGISNTPYYDK